MDTKQSRLDTVLISRLELDRENPRLMGRIRSATDEAIIGELCRTSDLEELFQSVSTNGYLDIEPLVVTPNANGALVVLEGNRRLATLRLLTDPALVSRVRAAQNLPLPVPAVPESLVKTLERVSVYEVPSREHARAFLGFKHINGPAKWDAYAKAKFAANWYKQLRPTHGASALHNVASSIGDRHDTIKRMVSAIFVLDQAERNELFDVADRYTRKFNFSHLYTALARFQYMRFLDIASKWSRYDPTPDPVPEDRLDRLREVLLWIYGSRQDRIRPVVRVQNPDIKRLGEVLENTEAVHTLRHSANLARAHAATETAETRFTTSLFRARDSLREVANALRGYDGIDSALLDIAEDIKESATSVYLRMKRKFHERP